MDCTQLLQAFTNLHVPSVVGEILEIIKENGIQCDAKAWAVIIAACSQSRSLGIGKLVHQQIQQERKEHDLYICTSLINMYGKTGALDLAQQVFDQHKSSMDVGLWTAMLTAYGHNGKANEALEIFKQMSDYKVPINSVTFLGLLNACSHAGLVEKAERILDDMKNYGVSPQLPHLTCMADVYGRAGQLDRAESILLCTHPSNNLFETKIYSHKCHRIWFCITQYLGLVASLEM